jgi:hypothetical protein
LLVDIATASRDPVKYPDPNLIKPDRSQDLYLPFFDGPHGSLVREIVTGGLVTQLRVLARLKNLRKAPGMQGTPKRKTENVIVSFLSEARDEPILFPTSKEPIFLAQYIQLTSLIRYEASLRLFHLTSLLTQCISTFQILLTNCQSRPMTKHGAISPSSPSIPSMHLRPRPSVQPPRRAH